MKRIIMAACIVSLAACGGDKDDVATEQQQDWESQNQSLVYSFPDNGQEQVPVPSPVVLRFTGPVMETAPAIVLREAGGPVVSDVEMEWVDGKRGLIITPDRKLKPMTEYLVQIPAIELEKGTAAARNLSFTTRGLYEGPKNQVGEASFEVTRMIPDGENYSVLDFSSFRVQFSQPLERSTVKYGSSADATVQLTGPNGLVDAHVLVGGSYMTIDPVQDLQPGVEYSLNMTSGITSIYGESLPGGFGGSGNTIAVSLHVTPKDSTSPTTGERVAMVQDVADTGELSPLTGMPINLVPMASVLLGEETATQASGIVAAELAFVPNFPDATPFRVKRGSLIEGASIEVLINGEVPAGFDSGKVRMDFISDASGYLLPNPYSNADDAPRQVRLFMDVAVSTETPQANGAITQDLLHIELVGTSIVEDGRMVINAVGVVEPDVLGAERATGILSFYMKAFEDQDNPPQIIGDTTPPQVQSWIPGDDVDNFRTTDPVVVQFNKPIDLSEGGADLVVLEENGMVVSNIDVRARGSALLIKPEDGFKRSVQSTTNINSVQSYVYTVTIKQGIKDVSGNSTLSDSTYQFELPTQVTRAELFGINANPATGTNTLVPKGEVDTVVRSPMITSVYPGFPCVIDDASLDLSQGLTGRCKGMLAIPYSRSEINSDGINIDVIPAKNPDDILPLNSLPSNRPIIAIFTKNIDPASVMVGGSFRVGEVDSSGNFIPGGEVEGNLKVDGKKITFYPNDPWEEGVFYAYVLGSNGDRHSPTANCDGSESICSEDGLPIQTQLYDTQIEYLSADDLQLIYQDHNAENGGGDPLVQFFVGAAEAESVVQILAAPSLDANANLIHERNTPRDLPTTRPLVANDYLAYVIEEEGADDQELDPNSPDACLDADVVCQDPGGLVPPPNSAKLLSNDLVDLTPVFTGTLMMPAVSIGCGFQWIIDGPPTEMPFSKQVCPEAKFTYLTSDLVTEVGEYSSDLGGVEVKIWPGQIMSTGLPLFTTLMPCGFCELGLDTGPQVMRMRYAKNDDSCQEDVVSGATCAREKPITAVIKDENGTLRISAEVDVYIDAIDLQRQAANVSILMTNNPLAETVHNVMSIPVTLNLEGDVVFNEDGTMQVGMMNTNEIVFGYNLDAYDPAGDIVFPLGYNHMIIPAFGSNVSYISEIIK